MLRADTTCKIRKKKISKEKIYFFTYYNKRDDQKHQKRRYNMNCNCKVTSAVLGVIILIVAIQPEWLGPDVSNWITIVAALMLVLHIFVCRSVCSPHMHEKIKRAKKKRR